MASAANLENKQTSNKAYRKTKCYPKQAAISQKEIVFRFRKDVQSEKGWGLMSCA